MHMIKYNVRQIVERYTRQKANNIKIQDSTNDILKKSVNFHKLPVNKFEYKISFA